MKQIDLNNEIVIYQSEDGKTQLDVKLEGETVWLNRQQLAELFGRDVKTIGKHINNALKEELNDASSVVAKFAATAAEGKDYQACFGARRSRKRNKGRNPCITARALFVFVNIKYESPLVTLLLAFDQHSLLYN